MQPWWKRVKRWGQTNHTEDDPQRIDIEFWRAHWKRLRIEGVIVNASGIVSYYPGRSPLQYRASGLGERDFFGEFVAAARQEGIAVVARMDVNRCTEDFYNAHPDWFCRDADGKPITSQGRYFSCINGGYYEEFIPDTLREIIELYHPDGFTDNSWSGMGRRAICYCDNCREKFERDTGLALPDSAEWGAPRYAEWIRWSTRRRTEVWDLFNGVTRAAGGPDCLWSGMLHADPASGCDSLRDLKALCARAKIIFTDHQSRDQLNGFEQNSLNGSLLRMASCDEDTLVPESIAHYVRGERTFRLAANPAVESRTWLIDGIAGGISPWYHHIGGSTRDMRQFDTSAALFAWHARNEDALYGRRDLARVAMVWDQDSAAYFGREQRRQKVSLPWRGFHHAMVRDRLAFLPVNAADLPALGDRADVVILPNLGILKGDARDAVLAHIAAGGGLVVTGDTDMHGPDGEPRPGGLWDALGLRLTGRIVGDGTASASWEDFAAHNYMLLPNGERHPILAGFEHTEIVPLGCAVRGVESVGPLAPVAGYVPSFPIYPPEFSWVRETRPELPTLFAGELPSGARVAYLPCDVDRACGEHMLPDHAALLINAVRWAAKKPQPLAVNGPGYLDCHVYAQGSRTIVHIVNLSGMNRRGYTEEVYPVGPIEVRAAFSGAGARASLRVAGIEKEAAVRDGMASVVVGSVADHEVVVFEPV